MSTAPHSYHISSSDSLLCSCWPYLVPVPIIIKLQHSTNWPSRVSDYKLGASKSLVPRNQNAIASTPYEVSSRVYRVQNQKSESTSPPFMILNLSVLQLIWLRESATKASLYVQDAQDVSSHVIIKCYHTRRLWPSILCDQDSRLLLYLSAFLKALPQLLVMKLEESHSKIQCFRSPAWISCITTQFQRTLHFRPTTNTAISGGH